MKDYFQEPDEPETDTPETDALFADWIQTRGILDDARELSRKLERQRNAAWQAIREIREIVTADESFGATVETLFAKPLEEAESEIARLQSLLDGTTGITHSPPSLPLSPNCRL